MHFLSIHLRQLYIIYLGTAWFGEDLYCYFFTRTISNSLINGTEWSLPDHFIHEDLIPIDLFYWCHIFNLCFIYFYIGGDFSESLSITYNLYFQKYGKNEISVLLPSVPYPYLIEALHRFHLPADRFVNFGEILFICDDFDALDILVFTWWDLLDYWVEKSLIEAASEKKIFFKSADCQFAGNRVGEHSMKLWISCWW